MDNADPWVKQLRPASFRGVLFKVDTSDVTLGRRNVVHEYPFRDIPYTEDLGKKAREINIRAYVINSPTGDASFLDLQDALIRAIEADATPGTLVHPILGTLQVVPKDCRHTWSNQEGGIAYFDLTFIEAGENKYPAQSLDTKGAVNDSADKAIEAIQSVIGGGFVSTGLPSYVAEAAQSILGDFTSNVESALRVAAPIAADAAKLRKAVATFNKQVVSIAQTPTALAKQATQLVAQLRKSFTSGKSAYIALAKLVDFGANLPAVAETTTTRKQQTANQALLVGMVQQTALVELANAVAEVPFDSYNDAVVARDDLAARLDSAIVAIGSTDNDDAYMALEGLRASMVKDVTDRAANLRRVKTIIPTKCMPALVTSYSLYQTASNDAEIVARNHVRHPGFLPANQPLEVLVS
jgi:prophage DNA circulation protein